MKKLLTMAMILVVAGVGACGQKAAQAPAEESAAVSETAGTVESESVAAETAMTETDAVETQPIDTQVPDTAAIESELPETADLETEAPETQAPETQAAGQDGYTNGQIRESQNAMCAAIDEAEAAFGILVIDPKFDGSWPDVQAAIEKSGYGDQYPYLTSLGIESYIETEGKGLVCIIPRDMQTSLAVNLVDEDLEVKKVLYRHELAIPLIIRANVDPEEPELLINAVSGDYQATFYLMSDEGKLLMPNGGGVYDFTE